MAVKSGRANPMILAKAGVAPVSPLFAQDSPWLRLEIGCRSSSAQAFLNWGRVGATFLAAAHR